MEERKTEKISFPTTWKNEKQKKVALQPLGSEKNAENSPSAADETQKSRKNARRRSTKRKKHEKTPVVGRRNAKNAKKRPSAVDEMQKTAKIDFRPWPKA
ncbi:MAG: hypothetical protein ACTTJ9_04060 [Segatella oris]|uniref:hypothetical protein n=1 Tax=Segatella oris TaxID=28135 RepID=UPI003FA2A2C5